MTIPPPDRRHFQFSLRGLLIFVSLLAVSFSCFHDAYSTEVLPHLLALFIACESFLIAIFFPFIQIWRTKLWFILILISGVFFAVLSPATSGWWDGQFKLSIDIQSKSSRPISAIFYEVLFDKNIAEYAAQNSNNSPSDFHQQLKLSSDGKKYLADVPCNGRFDLIGYYGYGEFRYIVILVKYDDGTQACVAAEIPKGRGNRSMTIEVP